MPLHLLRKLIWVMRRAHLWPVHHILPARVHMCERTAMSCVYCCCTAEVVDIPAAMVYSTVRYGKRYELIPIPTTFWHAQAVSRLQFDLYVRDHLPSVRWQHLFDCSWLRIGGPVVAGFRVSSSEGCVWGLRWGPCSPGWSLTCVCHGLLLSDRITFSPCKLRTFATFGCCCSCRSVSRVAPAWRP